MNDEDSFAVWLLVVVTITMLVSFVLGWVIAHATVAKECERLNSFYVSTVVYECKVRGLK